VRVFRGRKNRLVKRSVFIEKLGTVFMPMTVQMQRLFGLTAYLPAILPETKSEGMPDEIALVFYQTQGAYHEAKRCVGGRSYSELHQLLFDMPARPAVFRNCSPAKYNRTRHITCFRSRSTGRSEVRVYMLAPDGLK
jgi:hypothetical protein